MKKKVILENKYNTNFQQCNLYLNSKNQKKAGNIIRYGYKNGQREQKILKITFFLTKLDDKRNATGFYGKK